MTTPAATTAARLGAGNHPTPWWAHAVVYQVYLRSFADADGDGIGDLEGIRSRLPYIAALGADAIWLNPCYPSPQRDAGYDVADYFDIDPAYGSLDDFDRLVEHAEQYGIRVLMDIVPNHCSSEHPWFLAALTAGRGSAERERFYFRDGSGPGGNQPPNDWTAIFGGSAWTRVTERDGSPGQWYLGVFTPHQPDLNWHNEDVAEHFDRVLTFWFDRGTAGFRADAVNVVGKAPGLPDAGEQLGFGHPNRHFSHHPAGLHAWARWRRLVTEYNAAHPGRDTFLIAEAWTPPGTDVFTAYVNDEAFHQGFAFELMMSNWRAQDWRRSIGEVLALTVHRGTHPAWTLNNHDMERTVTRFGRGDARGPRPVEHSNLVGSTAPVDEILGRRRALAAALTVLALPGSVYLYAGEELALRDVVELPDHVRRDPIIARSGGTRKGRDGCRVPLPWTVSPRASHGFSTGESPAASWLPQPPDWGRRSAEVLERDPESSLHLYRNAVATRRQVTDLRTGSLEWVDLGPDAVAFRRGEVLVVLNMGRDPLPLPPEVVCQRRQLLTSGSPVEGAARSSIPPDTCVWFAP